MPALSCYIFYFSLLYLPTLLHTIFAYIFFLILILFNLDCVSSVGFKHIDYSCHDVLLKCKWLNLNFLKSAQLFIDGGIESNQGPTQNDCKYLHTEDQGKLLYLKEHQKILILVRAVV